VVVLLSSSFFRRDRLAAEARLDPTTSTGASSLGIPDCSVDMVVITNNWMDRYRTELGI
jgi:hypothetical protein